MQNEVAAVKFKLRMTHKASGDDDIEFRELIAAVSKRVDNHTLEELKYQCGDIGRGRLERVTSALGLFELLEERDEVSMEDVSFLGKILKNIGRMDLCKLVGKYQASQDAVSKTQIRETSTAEGCSAPDAQLETQNQPAGNQKGFTQNTSAGKSIKTTYHSKDINEGQNFASPFNTDAEEPYPYHLAQNHGHHHRSRNSRHNPPSQQRAIPPDLDTALQLVIVSMSRGWQSAVRHLGVPDPIIDNAEDNWPRNVRNQIKEAFEYWARTDPDASKVKLIQAMRHVGRNDIGDDLQYG